MQHGTRKRQRFDPFARSSKPRWLVVKDDCSRLIEYTTLPPGTDLRAALDAEEAARAAAGWTIEEAGRAKIWAGFFCHRDGERISVSLNAVEPRT